MADRDVTVHQAPGQHNSLWYWAREVGVLKTLRNYVLMALARICPSLGLKNWLYRRMGIDVGPTTSIGLEATMDIFYPELIEIGEDSIVGFDSVILCHEFLVDEYRTGPVTIGDRVSIGANVTILPGVEIGNGATVSAHSLVNRDVPEGAFYGGVPARPLDRSDEAQRPGTEGPERSEG